MKKDNERQWGDLSKRVLGRIDRQDRQKRRRLHLVGLLILIFALGVSPFSQTQAQVAYDTPEIELHFEDGATLLLFQVHDDSN